MVRNLVLEIDGMRVPLRDGRRRPRWPGRWPWRGPSPRADDGDRGGHPLVAMDARTRVLLDDLAIIDDLLALVANIDEARLRAELTDELVAAARRTAPGGVAVRAVTPAPSTAGDGAVGWSVLRSRRP